MVEFGVISVIATSVRSVSGPLRASTILEMAFGELASSNFWLARALKIVSSWSLPSISIGKGLLLAVFKVLFPFFAAIRGLAALRFCCCDFFANLLRFDF